jgi:hypothetical protein
MGTPRGSHQRVEWRLAEQRFGGTLDEVASQVDRLIVILVALRNDLPVNLRVEEPPVRRLTRAWARLLSLLGMVSCLLAVPDGAGRR